MPTSTLNLVTIAERGERAFKKIIISIGLILLVTGIAISTLQAQETYLNEPVTVRKVTVGVELRRTLEPPQNTTSYSRYMESGMLFKLNLSSSDPVKVTVSYVQHSATGPTKVSIFEQQGSSFDQKVSISGRGTYYVDITNENPFPVTLDGNVLVQQRETNYRTIYPYVIHGFIIMLGGSSLLVYGTLKKTKKPSKSKRLSKGKIKSK